MIDPGASGADVVNVEIESTCGRPVDHTALINDPASLGLIEWGLTRAPGDHAPVCGATG